MDTELKKKQEERIDVLRKLVDYPPYFKQYEPQINRLAQLVDATFEERVKKKFEVGGRLKCKGSVFIMTKYPGQENSALDSELRAIIDLVSSTVADCGYEPLLADEMNLHDYLWDNVVCHMLACSHGIAIVESKFRPELNPNVAMEWGWMRAMRKPVLWLIEKDAEKDVKFMPADVGGLIRAPFDWQKPQSHIPNAVIKYFQGQQVARLL